MTCNGNRVCAHDNMISTGPTDPKTSSEELAVRIFEKVNILSILRARSVSSPVPTVSSALLYVAIYMIADFETSFWRYLREGHV